MTRTILPEPTETILGCIRIRTEEFPTGLTQITLWGPGRPGRPLAIVEHEFPLTGLTGWFCYAGPEDSPLEYATETRLKALGWAIRTASKML
jgi:hypothetical protein